MWEECIDAPSINFVHNNLTICFRESHNSKILSHVSLQNSFDKFSLNLLFYSITFYIRFYAIYCFPIKIICCCLFQVLGRIYRTDRK